MRPALLLAALAAATTAWSQDAAPDDAPSEADDGRPGGDGADAPDGTSADPAAVGASAGVGSAAALDAAALRAELEALRAATAEARAAAEAARQALEALNPPPKAEEPGPRKTVFTPPPGGFSIGIDGRYSVWILNQHGFLLGLDQPLDDADYVVQALRVNFKAGTRWFGVQARFDAAEGWWGVDNSPDVTQVAGTAADGAVTSTPTYNPYKLFGDKDTNYLIHFDHAYGWVAPPLPFELRFAIGRQPFRAGHGLVLEGDYEGLRLRIRPVEPFGMEGIFAVLSEGLGSYKTPAGTLMSDAGDWGDALLAGGALDWKLGPLALGFFGLHYWDRSGSDAATFFPQGIGYLGARFQPNVSRATAFGLTLDGTVDVLGGLDLAFEGDFLFGDDRVRNGDHAGGLLDRNDGLLLGWNVWGKVAPTLVVGPVQLHPALAVGAGSGDADPTGGRGNLNRIQTMGFFPLTHVWEDSVMPDVAGISPQGLGSPVSRGYRELENTFALQGRFGVTPAAPVTLATSYTWLRAVAPIHGWDATGAPTAVTSQDIGHEVDVDLVVRLLPRVTCTALFGAFVPGEGAALLITGDAANRQTAWEVKQVVDIAF